MVADCESILNQRHIQNPDKNLRQCFLRKWLKLIVKAKSSIFGGILNVSLLIPLFSNASSLQKHYDTHTLWYLTYIVSKPNFKEHFAYSTSNVTSVPKNEVFHISSVNTENIINGKSCLFYNVFSLGAL